MGETFVMTTVSTQYTAIYSIDNYKGESRTAERLVNNMRLVFSGVFEIRGSFNQITPDKVFDYLTLLYEKYIAQTEWNRISPKLVEITKGDESKIDERVIQVVDNLKRARWALQAFLQDWGVKCQYFPLKRLYPPV